MTLPPSHRAYLKAFWVIMTLSGSGLVIGASWMSGNLWGLVLGIGIGCVLLVFGLMEINLKVMWIAYRVWNRLSELVTSVLQTAIVAITFFIIFAFVGKWGSALRMDMPKSNQSLWEPRGTMPVNAYESQSGFPRPSRKDSHWGKFLISWATKSGKYWIWFLLPFLYILSFLDTEPSEETPAGVYTLF